MADPPQQEAQSGAERIRRYRAGMRTDLRRLEAKLDDLRDQVVALKQPCPADRPGRNLSERSRG
jgi:hypothetical protein